MNIINKRSVWLWGRGTTIQKGLLVKVALLKLHYLHPVDPRLFGELRSQVSVIWEETGLPGGKAMILVANPAGFFYK